MQSTDHTHFYSGPNARSADREDSLSPDTTFQPETHMFLPDKMERCLFLRKIRRKEGDKSRRFKINRMTHSWLLWDITGTWSNSLYIDSQIRKSYICMLMRQPGPGISGGASVWGIRASKGRKETGGRPSVSSLESLPGFLVACVDVLRACPRKSYCFSGRFWV